MLLISACSSQKFDALRDHGKEAQATVLRKDVSISARVNNRHHTLDIGFFAEKPEDKETGISVLGDTTMSMADRLDKWQPGKSGIGTYMHVQIDIEPSQSGNYGPGDKVQVVYLPEDPNVVTLKENLYD